MRYRSLKNEFKYKGNWFSFFKNNNPIVLELGCGKGEYSINLAEKFPDKNFIGMDIKGARLWHGAKNAIKYNQNALKYNKNASKYVKMRQNIAKMR